MKIGGFLIAILAIYVVVQYGKTPAKANEPTTPFKVKELTKDSPVVQKAQPVREPDLFAGIQDLPDPFAPLPGLPNVFGVEESPTSPQPSPQGGEGAEKTETPAKEDDERMQWPDSSAKAPPSTGAPASPTTLTGLTARDAERVALKLPLFTEAAAAYCPLPIDLLLGVWKDENDMCLGTPEEVCKTSKANAKGPMQFTDPTWHDYGAGGNVQNLHDAVHAAARMFCANGGADDRAILRYNNSREYLASIRSRQMLFRAALGERGGPVVLPTMRNSDGALLATGTVDGCDTVFPIAVGLGWLGSLIEEAREGHKHQGNDITADAGTPVYAASDGRVEFAGENSEGESGRRAGIQVRLDQHCRKAPGTLAGTRYFHLQRVAVKTGETVRRGQLIGWVGTTGVYSSGPHLHLEAFVWEQGGGMVRFWNPLRFVNVAGHDPSVPLYAGPKNSRSEAAARKFAATAAAHRP